MKASIDPGHSTYLVDMSLMVTEDVRFSRSLRRLVYGPAATPLRQEHQVGVMGCVEAKQGRAHSRRSRPSGAALTALLMSQAAHYVEPKAVVRIEATASPRPCLGCAVELVLRIAPLRRGVPSR
jgi:hypothetical protein